MTEKYSNKLPQPNYPYQWDEILQSNPIIQSICDIPLKGRVLVINLTLNSNNRHGGMMLFHTGNNHSMTHVLHLLSSSSPGHDKANNNKYCIFITTINSCPRCCPPHPPPADHSSTIPCWLKVKYDKAETHKFRPSLNHPRSLYCGYVVWIELSVIADNEICVTSHCSSATFVCRPEWITVCVPFSLFGIEVKKYWIPPMNGYMGIK